MTCYDFYTSDLSWGVQNHCFQQPSKCTVYKLWATTADICSAKDHNHAYLPSAVSQLLLHQTHSQVCHHRWLWYDTLCVCVCLRQICSYCHPRSTCFAGLMTGINSSDDLLVKATVFNATVQQLWADGWSHHSTGGSGAVVNMYILQRVKTRSRSRATDHSIWLYHVLLNERFTHTDH